MNTYLGVITTKPPGKVISKIVARINANFKIVVFVNSSCDKLVAEWLAYADAIPLISVIHGDKFFQAGYSRNRILAHISSNEKNSVYRLWLLDDDMLPSLLSLEHLLKLDKPGIFIPKRREIVNGKRISFDFFKSKLNAGGVKFRPGGSLILVKTFDVQPFPENVKCEEESIWSLRNYISNGHMPKLINTISFTHFGRTNQIKKVSRKIGAPYFFLMFYLVKASFVRGFNRDILYAAKQIFKII
ncbi:MAG: hypothetical protein COA59_07225 [Colwellia sp.]|jgi:hypothetical protein|nr:MAG: hypothetical protein COA59_07225 [Colwellia sp.]